MRCCMSFFTSGSLPWCRACFPADPEWKGLLQKWPVTPTLSTFCKKGRRGNWNFCVHGLGTLSSHLWVRKSKQERQQASSVTRREGPELEMQGIRGGWVEMCGNGGEEMEGYRQSEVDTCGWKTALVTFSRTSCPYSAPLLRAPEATEFLGFPPLLE